VEVKFPENFLPSQSEDSRGQRCPPVASCLTLSPLLYRHLDLGLEVQEERSSVKPRMEAVVSPTYSKLGLRSVQLSSSKGDRKGGILGTVQKNNVTV
jgi:hypothetical protein